MVSRRSSYLPNPKFAAHPHPRSAPLSGTSRCSARQFCLAEHRIRPYRGLKGTWTCSTNFGSGPGSFSRHPRAGPRLPWRRCVFGRGTCTANRPPTPSSGAGPHPFSTPAPNTPDTCTKNRHYLRQPSCFPVIRVFRQNAAREGRSYAPGWGLRCAKCRYRPVAHRNHRHIAQEGASCAPVWQRAATGLPARQGFPVGSRAPQWHIAMIRAARFPGWFARRSRRGTYGQKKPRKNTPSVPQVDLLAHSGDEQVVARKISKISEQLLYL